MNELGFTENWIKSHFSSEEFEDFLKFMRGQTIGIINNEITYYYYDVQNFCALYGVTYPQ